MRAFLLLTYFTLIFETTTTLAQEITWKGQIKEYRTNIPMANAKIVFIRIGDNDTTYDTITTKSNGTYIWTFPFELIPYKIKYHTIKFYGVRTETHWYRSRTWWYYPEDLPYMDITAIPVTQPTTYLLSGRVGLKENMNQQAMEGINLLCSRYNTDSSEIKDTVLVTDSEGHYSIPIQNNKGYTYYITITSKIWQEKLIDNSTTLRCDGFVFTDQWKNFYVKTIEIASTDWIMITGKTTLPTGVTNASIYLNDSLSTISDMTTGRYVCYVPKGWSGTITAEKRHHEWESPIQITNIQSDQTINFTGSRKMCTISGHVYIEHGDSIDFVFLSETVTDSNGFYSMRVPYGFPVYITPIKKSYSFYPDSVTFFNVINDITMDFFTTAEEQVNIEGNISNETRSGIDNVVLNFSGNNGQCVSDSKGSFTHKLRLDWSGSITPQKEGYIFEPAVYNIERMNKNTTISFTGNPSTDIVAKPIVIQLNKPQTFEIQIFNPTGRLVGKATNMSTAEILKRNATGMYIYKKIIKNAPIKTRQILFVR